jgi:ribosomal protein L7Ae-like RNA K-turn-binding protein
VVALGENLIEKQLERGWAKEIGMASSMQIKSVL